MSPAAELGPDDGGRVAVVGLGATGALALWSLARRGIPVTGFERNTTEADTAAYGGYTRQFRLTTHDRHHERHLHFARRSQELWRALEAESGERLLLMTGQLGIGPRHDPDIATLAENLDRYGLGYDRLEPGAAMDRFPAHRLTHDEVAIFVHDAGVLRSNLAVATAIAQARDAGAAVVDGQRIEGIEFADGGGASLLVAGERRFFERVIVTAGPWTAELVPDIGKVVTPRAIVTGWYAVDEPDRFTPADFPPGFRRSERAAQGFTFLPALDGRGVKLIHWMPTRPSIPDTARWSATVDPDLLDAARPAIEAALPSVHSTPEAASVYLEGFTADRFPVLARPNPGVSVLCGFSGMGFAVAPAMGEMVAAQALGEASDMDASALAFDRVSLTGVS
jgi:sarcosine oxidase